MSKIASIKKLLGKVPGPPGEPIPEGVAEEMLVAFSERTGIVLPQPLIDWLMTTNGPCVGPGGLFGIRPSRPEFDIEHYYELFPGWRSNGWISIGGDGCGNYFVLSTQQEFGPGWPVLFIETMQETNKPAYIVASDLWMFLQFLLEDELSEAGWPFDREEVTKRDPRIEQFHGVLMPWQAELNSAQDEIGVTKS